MMGTHWATGHVGSVALVIFPAELAAHTEEKPMSANLWNAAPFWESRLGNLRGGIFSLRRNAGQGRRHTCATSPFDRVGSVFVPLESTSRGEKKPAEADQLDERAFRHRRRGYFCGGDYRRYGEKTNERETPAQRAVLGEFSRICTRRRFSIQAGSRPSATTCRRDVAVSAKSALFVLRRSRLLRRQKQTSAEKLSEGASWQRPDCVPPPANPPVLSGRKRRPRIN